MMTQEVRPSGCWMSRSVRSSRRKAGQFGWGAEATAEANWLKPRCLENSSFEVLWVTVPQPDTGRREEHSQAFERTPVKELGKMAP